MYIAHIKNPLASEKLKEQAKQATVLGKFPNKRKPLTKKTILLYLQRSVSYDQLFKQKVELPSQIKSSAGGGH